MSCMLLLSVQNSYSQIGIGTTSPDGSAILDVSSTSKGVLFPRLTSIQRDAIVNPSHALMIYNLDNHCLQVNKGIPLSPNWFCVGDATTSSIGNNCDVNGFEGIYINGEELIASNKFSVTISNNSSRSLNINFTSSDLVLNGVNGMVVSSVNPTSATLLPGNSEVIEYTLTGTPSSLGSLTGVWTKLGLNCTKTVNIVKGNAMFNFPQLAVITSVNDGTPTVDIPGVIDNNSNLFTVSIPYTYGMGAYDAYTGTYTLSNPGTGEGGDANSLRLTYPSGTFSTSGSIIATIEVDGDGSFNAKKQLFSILDTIASLNFQVNGVSQGNLILGVGGGIFDRNFTDVNHKFIYFPIVAADGKTWLNNNLGAHYSNMNHPEFDPTRIASSEVIFNAYGSMFQWGRYSDGHELINYTNFNSGTAVNGTTATNAVSDTPVNNLFITEDTSPYDWRVTQNDNLWQGEAGINNPCPRGYRVPTQAELTNLALAEDINDLFEAGESSLGISASGSRLHSTAQIRNVSRAVILWSSTTSGTLAQSLRSTFTYADTRDMYRASGANIRCIKD